MSGMVQRSRSVFNSIQFNSIEIAGKEEANEECCQLSREREQQPEF